MHRLKDCLTVTILRKESFHWSKIARTHRSRGQVFYLQVGSYQSSENIDMKVTKPNVVTKTYIWCTI